MNDQENRDTLNQAESGRAPVMDSSPAGISATQPVPPHDAGKIFSPIRFLAITIGGIFLAEIVAMIVVYRLQVLPYSIQTMIDASIMVIMIFPLVYNFSLKPLLRHIEERRQAEEALRHSEERFIKAFHSSPAALCITRIEDGHFLDVNRSFLHLFGYERQEVIGHTSIDLNLYVNTEERVRLIQETVARQLLAEEGVRDREVEARRKSGEIHTVLISSEALELDGKASILASITDITERKRSEEQLRRFNRALKMISRCNEVLVRAENEADLVQEMCEIIVDTGGYRMAWVGYAEQDEASSVRPVALAGFEDGYLSQAQISWADADRGRGPTGTAIRTGRIQVNQNSLINPSMSPWRELAAKRDYQSSIALPLRAGNSVFGALTIYSQSPDAFDPEEVHQLSELASDLEFGINALRERIERQRAEKQVREMALFPALNPDAVLQVDASGLIRTTNPAAAAWGLRRGAFLAELVPDLRNFDLGTCITEGTTQQVADTRLGELNLLWTIHGEPERGLAFLYSTDMTEYRKAEKVIRRLSRIVEQTDDSVVVTNREGVIEYVNPAFEHLTGYTKEEALGNTPRILKSGLHDVNFYRELWERILGGQAFHGEIANCKKNGELFYEAKIITPLRNLEGEITHFVATGKDITEHKRDEEELRRANDELELRVEERTEELRIAISELEEEIHIRRRAEDALRQSEERLNRAQEIAHLGSWDLDLENNRLTWSDETYRIFGLQPQEFDSTYEGFLEAVHPDDRAAVDNAYAESVRAGRDSYEIEHRVVRRPSGEIRFVHEKCEHFRDEHGRVIRSVGMVHDITERKAADDALREAAERFRIVSDFTYDWEYWRGANNHFYYISPSCEAITGYSREAFDEDPDLFLRIVHPEDRERLTRHYHDDLLNEEPCEMEFRIIRRDGQERWLGHACRLVLDNEGRRLGRRASNRDITQRRQMEEALRRAHDELELRVKERTRELAFANQELLREIAERKEIERQLRIRTTAMEAAANGIVITDRRGTIQWTNPALPQISGYDVAELIGQNMRILKSGQQDDEYYRKMWKTIRSGLVWRGEIVNRHKDGSLYVEEQTITPVRDENGQISHFIAVKQDITQRKHAEEELERRNLELQAISTAEHKQRQFSEALVEAALVLDKSVKLEELLSLILEQIKGVIPYQFADVMLLDGESFYEGSRQGTLDLPDLQTDLKQHFSLSDFPVLKKMRQSGRPVLIADTQQEPGWFTLSGLAWSRSFLSAPLLAEQRVIGFVNLFAEQPGFFTEEMSSHLVAFAAHAAVAIQNAWLFEQVRAGSERLQSLSRRLVEIQESERLYISRELHDEAGQMLTAMMVELRMLEQNASQPEVVLSKIPKLESSLNQVLENLHRVAMALRPARLDHVGLVAALRQHVESVGETHGLKVSFRSAKALERLPANVETVLYRIVQEALTNVVRHAHATRVDVVLTRRDDKLIVIVEDDGVGFDTEAASNSERLGLFGMRERAEMIDGRLLIESAPGKGTTIMMEVKHGDTHSGRR